MAFPPSFGFGVTPTLHHAAEGFTLPSRNPVPEKPFVVVITGAGKGIGFHTALAYAQAGATGLVVSSRTQSDLDELSRQVKGINSSIDVLALISDTSKEDDVARLAAETKKRFGRADVVVANAGVSSKVVTEKDGSKHEPKNIEEDEDLPRVMAINFFGTYYLAKYFVPLLKSSPHGGKAFVAISSVVSHFANSGFTTMAYNLSKFTQNRLIETLHGDYHASTGLNFYAVHPGVVLTPLTERVRDLADGAKWNSGKTDFFCVIADHPFRLATPQVRNLFG
jgi:NAD(P)-dependent dehydrogenase (short-subunit alcohol dehydrogenase family)